MFKIRALFFALAISAMFVVMTSIAKAESIIYPRVSLSYEVVNINNIPSSLRTFYEYNNASSKLPGDAVGGYFRLSLGAGIKLEKKIHVAYDLSLFDSCANPGGINLLVATGMPFFDAYRYKGIDSDFSATILLYELKSSRMEDWEDENVNNGVYLKGGIRFNNGNLSSKLTTSAGAQAHSKNIYGKSYSAGIGFSVPGDDEIVAFEFLYNGSFDNDPRIQTYSIGIRYSEMKFNK